MSQGTDFTYVRDTMILNCPIAILISNMRCKYIKARAISHFKSDI